MQKISYKQFGRQAQSCSWRISIVIMHDSIDSDFLRKPCFECEQHLKINLAQPLVMHNSCFVLFRIVMLIFLSTTEAAPVNVFEWTFIIESLIVLSQFPLRPATFSDAALQCLLEHRCFRGDDQWRHEHWNVYHRIYPDGGAKESGNATSIWTAWGLTQLPQQSLFGVWAVQSGLKRANTHSGLFVIHFTIGFNYVQSPLYISKPRFTFFRCQLSKHYCPTQKLRGISP